MEGNGIGGQMLSVFEDFPNYSLKSHTPVRIPAYAGCHFNSHIWGSSLEVTTAKQLRHSFCFF